MTKYLMSGKPFLIIVSVVLLATGCSFFNTSDKFNKSTSIDAPIAVSEKSVSESNVISYQGVEGKNALEILKSIHAVETQNFVGVGEFVKSINGVTPEADQFWGFYVNGQSSQVGAGDYQTVGTDMIEWKLEVINN